MKIYKTLIAITIIALAFASCEKINEVEEKPNDKIKKTMQDDDGPMIPPYRWTDKGPYKPDHPNGPYPYISCPAVGWTCLVGVMIWGQEAGSYQGDSYNDYSEAASNLKDYISNNNTSEFFNNHSGDAELLMPGLYEGTEEANMVLEDLKQGYTTVRMHPDTIASGEVLYLCYIEVQETGEPPVYNE